MVLALTGLLGVVSADGRPDAGRLALVLVAMFLSQLAIGWTNDYLDRAKDAIFQPSKPIPAGLVDARLLLPALALALIGSLVTGAFLGITASVWLLAGTFAGLAYDAGVKDSRFSALPYVCAFAVLPPFVWAALDVYRDDFLWLYAVGTPLTVAAHLANVLPDLETDAAAGRRGVAVRLGRRRSLQLLAGCLALPVATTAASFAWLEYEIALLAAALVLYAILLAAAARAYASWPRRSAAVRAFRLVGIASVLFASGWLAALG